MSGERLRDGHTPLFIRYGLAPLTFAVVAASAYAGAQRGIDSGVVMAAATVMVGLGLFIMERRYPDREVWAAPDGQLGNDVGHALLGTGLGGAVGFKLATLTAGLLRPFINDGPNWPPSWPWAIQLVLALLLIDLGRSLQHRLLHRVSFLWRFHLLHHDITALGVIKTARAHFVERVTQQVCLFTPVLLLGGSAEVIFVYSLGATLLGLFAHANLDTRWGVLDLVLMTPRAHRIHHAVDARSGNSNFGDLFVIWDHVFGTFERPTVANRFLEVGAQTRGARDFAGQCLDPLKVR